MKASTHLLLSLTCNPCVIGFIFPIQLQRPGYNGNLFGTRSRSRVPALATPDFSMLGTRRKLATRHSDLNVQPEMSGSGAINDKPAGRSKLRTAFSWTEDFLFGVNYVHSRYLSILWRYSIVQSLAITLPFAILLWASQLYSATLASQSYTILYRILYSILEVSLWVARLLQLPLEFMKWTLTSMPTILISLLEYLPNFMAIRLVKALLFVQDRIASTTVVFTRNQYAAFLSSALAVLVWRPAVEEWQYRSILNKFFLAPDIIQKLPETIKSTALTLRSPLRDNTAAPSFTMVEFIPLTSVQKPDDEGVTTERKETVDGDDGTVTVRKSVLPSLSESRRILLGSLLFATTRLGWLSADCPGDDLYASPYGWTIGFLQSIRTHFSSQVLLEVRPSIRIWILLLAIHQAVSTFLVAQHVLANLYRERGLAASVGGHIAWTVGKGTIGFRFLWRLLIGLYQTLFKFMNQGMDAFPIGSKQGLMGTREATFFRSFPRLGQTLTTRDNKSKEQENKAQ